MYSATTQGSPDIWIANSDGSQPRQLTSDPGTEAQPQVLPDGKGIVFISRRPGDPQFEIRAIDLDGSNQRQIVTGGGMLPGYLQAIGDHVYFRALEGRRLVKLPGAARRRSARAGCSPIRLGVPPGFMLSQVAPDERSALGTLHGSRRVPAWRSCPSTDRGRSASSHPTSRGARASVPPGRRAERRSKTWSSGMGPVNLWRFPLDGSAPRPVTTFTSEQILNYRWSRDGKTLAMSRGTLSADVVLITSEET